MPGCKLEIGIRMVMITVWSLYRGSIESPLPTIKSAPGCPATKFCASRYDSSGPTNCAAGDMALTADGEKATPSVAHPEKTRPDRARAANGAQRRRVAKRIEVFVSVIS
jgi:hypothetical protein